MRVVKWILAIVAVLLVIAYLGICFLIGWGVNSASRTAENKFHKDRIESLIAFVDCKDCSLRDRESAVWALGQLHDKRALPVLYKYRTHRPCNHVSQICQYELETAIKWTEGNSYMLPQLWRIMLKA
jgi:hypothetical protein